LTVELVGHFAAIGADPVIVKSVDYQRSAVGKHNGLCRFINPETQLVFCAYFLCQAVQVAAG